MNSKESPLTAPPDQHDKPEKKLPAKGEGKKRQKPAPKRHPWFSEVGVVKFIAILCLIILGLKLLGLSCGEALKIWRDVAGNFK